MADFSPLAKQELQKMSRIHEHRVQRKQTFLGKKVCDDINTPSELLLVADLRS